MGIEARLRRWLLLGLTASAFLLTTGCTPSVPAAARHGMAVIVFIDFSASITGDDRAAYRREIEAEILPTLSAGDRLLIAPIHDKTLTEFRPLVDINLPAKPQFSGWLDNVMKHNRDTKAVESQIVQLKEKAGTSVAQVFTKKFVSAHTDIMSSLLIAQKLFYDEQRRKVLVLMSDMLEDTPAYNFERIAWNPAAVTKTLSELDAKGLIPKLHGVCVYVSGASAKSAELAENVGRFWQAYFQRAGADMDPSRYSHVLLHWPPAKSCRGMSTARAS